MNNILIQELTREEQKSDFREVVREVVRQELQIILSINAPKEYLTKQETASLLRLSLPTLQRLTKSGKIKGHKIGRRVLYRSDEIQDAMKIIETLKYTRS